MKTQAPIKRHQALVAFSKDHHFGLLLIWKIKQGLANAIRVERITNYILYFFGEYLLQHFKEEEQNLFPKLPADHPLYQRAVNEHEVIYDIIYQLRYLKDNGELVKLFAETLNNHIRFEERELFAYLQQTLPEPELQAITSHHNCHSSDEDSRWQDQFWLLDKSKQT
ncbi:MAG TPA: hemerythrin domain-containing protein [Flavitalea sp.]|nr:hemerythrin domain-containing protein [Flavitalea sp.]